MNTLVRRCAILVALVLWSVSTAPAQTRTVPKVEKIEIVHVGPPAASESLIRANIRVKSGEDYSRNLVDQDINSLYATGFFFNVQVVENNTASGVDLTFKLQGKPVVTDIKFTGNTKYRHRALMKKVTSKIGDPLDERKLFADTQEILKTYQKRGYQKTQVKYSTVIDEKAGRGQVIFEITEAPKVKIKRVEFVGAKAFKQKKLRTVVKTRKRNMFSWLIGGGVLKDEEFEDDKERLVDFYRGEGYIDFQITDVKFDLLDPKWMVMRWLVNEGRQYKVGSIEIKGNKLFKTEDVRRGYAPGKGMKMVEGKTFTPKGLTSDIEAIQNFYGSKGYIGKETASRVAVNVTRKPNVETGTMDLVFELEEGEKSYIEKIEIRGNVKTKDRVIRRELSVTPGEIFNKVKVDLSKTRLTQMNYFEKVETEPEPTDVPNHRNLVISVEEKNTGNFMVGAGFSTVDSIVGFVELSQGNFDLFKPPWFMGGGQKFRMRVQVGTQRQDYTINFIEPWFLGQKLALSTDLYYREMSYLSKYYDVHQAGARLGLSKAIGSDFFVVGVSYTIEDIGIVNITDPAPAFVKDPEEAGHHLISKVGTSIAYDTRNHATMPDKGQRTEFLTEVAGGPFGADKDFYKLEMRTSWYFKGFWEKHIIEVLGRAGVSEAYGDTTNVPIFDRWYLGGMYSLRGFKYHHAGADDTFDPVFGEPMGGQTYWMGSVEYSLPIVERLRLAFFYDIGNVYWKPYSWQFSDYLDNVGIGLRLNLPIGPLRFDYGIPMSTGLFTGDKGRFNFGVGYTREF